jgi:hypothetical protein
MIIYIDTYSLALVDEEMGVVVDYVAERAEEE